MYGAYNGKEMTVVKASSFRNCNLKGKRGVVIIL